MPLPLRYSLESLRVRWSASLVALFSIAGSVAVFVAMLALSRGFEAALVASGSPANAIVRRAGSTSETDSLVTLDQVRVIEDAPEVERGPGGARVSAEIVVVIALKQRQRSAAASVQVRGVSARALLVHDHVRVLRGRAARPGLLEVMVGKQAEGAYLGLTPGSALRIGASVWTVVGVFEAGGSAFESEIWGDGTLLTHAFDGDTSTFRSVTARLREPAALEAFRDRLLADPRMRVQVERETDYYRRLARQMTSFIETLGALVTLVMACGAALSALNTVYSALADRTREIATIRALGFGEPSVVASVLTEALCIALAGGLLGCLVTLPLDGVVTRTMNVRTFAQVSFAFQITPGALGAGLLFALSMGLLGGLPPALKVVYRPVATALREP